MHNDHINDISIGQDKWIAWIELDHDQTPFEIDHFLEPTIPFWKFLEIHCVSACCGIDAFSVWPEELKHAQLQLNDDLIKQKFEKLKSDLEAIPDTQITSSYLNNLFDKNFFLQVTHHIISHL